MCGIYGTTNKQINIEKKLLKIKHRGPNDLNYLKLNKLQIGQVRYSINGNLKQPFKYNNIIFAVNGEFYNIKEILQKYKIKQLKTNTDSEILQYLYPKFSIKKICNILNGEYSFIIIDNDKLYLIRDRFGTKPMYYRYKNDILEFGSELKLFDNKQINNKCINEIFKYQYHHNNITLYQDIYQVKPGYYLEIDLNTFNIKEIEYFNINNIYINNKLNNYTKIRNSLINAVKERINTNKNIGLTLSGGLDSTLILGIIKKILNKDISTFSISFKDDNNFNEIDSINKILKFYNIKNSYILELNNITLYKHLKQSIIIGEDIIVNSHITAKNILFNYIKNKGIDITLSGEGSDELFFGYQHLVNDFNPNFQNNNKNINDYMFSNNIIINNFNHNLSYIPNFLKAKLKIGNIISQFLKFNIDDNFYFNYTNKNKPYLSQELWLNLCFSNYILLTLGDKLEMFNTIEGRYPFLDKNLLNNINKLDNNFVNKKILKDIFKDILPEFILKKEKHPFVSSSILNNNIVKQMFIEDLNDFKNNKYININKLIEFIKNKNNFNLSEEGSILIIFSFLILTKNLK